jgi:hypothetical protein
MPNWKVELFVFGPIAVIDQMQALRELKGRNPDDLFYTDYFTSDPAGQIHCYCKRDFITS